MSPKVYVALTVSQFSKLMTEPKARCALALHDARDRGYILRRRLGVVCGLSDWRVDRSLQPTGVSLVGAVLLSLQPEPNDDDDHLAHAARALGVSLAWVAGADAGWCGDLMDVARLAALDASLYLDGFAIGEALAAQFGYGGRR